MILLGHLISSTTSKVHGWQVSGSQNLRAVLGRRVSMQSGCRNRDKSCRETGQYGLMTNTQKAYIIIDPARVYSFVPEGVRDLLPLTDSMIPESLNLRILELLKIAS